MSDLIRREDAIRAIDLRVRIPHDVVSAQYASMAKTAIYSVPSADRPQEWIPCSERLPKDGRYYVTRIDYVTNTIFTDILWYEKGIWWNRQYTGDFAVIAWMPLPEPWEGADDDIH